MDDFVFSKLIVKLDKGLDDEMDFSFGISPRKMEAYQEGDSKQIITPLAANDTVLKLEM